MPVLAEHTISPVRSHETVFVRGGGGGIQTVPWNLPADGNVRVGLGDTGDATVFGAFGLTDADKQKLAQRIHDAQLVSDIAAILEVIPTDAERQEVAALAVSIGADAQRIRQAYDELGFKDYVSWTPSPLFRIFWGTVATVSLVASAYHGYKRNHDSIGWGIWWGLMGATFPIITPIIAYVAAPGFAQPKKNGLARYRRRRRS